MPTFLSQEWLDEFRSLAQDQPTRPGATLSIQYSVTGGPDGDVEYYWVLDEGKLLEAKLGNVPDGNVTISMTYDDAAKLQQGELEATAAFMQGRMKVAGNMGKMMSLLPITNSPEWKTLQGKIGAVTDY